MNPTQEFYICSSCFNATENDSQCHGKVMIHYPGYPAGHPQLKPAIGKIGNIQTAMPRWMLNGIKTVDRLQLAGVAS